MKNLPSYVHIICTLLSSLQSTLVLHSLVGTMSMYNCKDIEMEYFSAKFY